MPTPITSVPQQGPAQIGVVQYRDQTVPVIALHRKFGLTLPEDSQCGRFIIAHTHHGLVAFWVDEVHEISAHYEPKWGPTPQTTGDIVFDKTLLWQDKILLHSDVDKLFAMPASDSLQAFSMTHSLAFLHDQFSEVAADEVSPQIFGIEGVSPVDSELESRDNSPEECIEHEESDDEIPSTNTVETPSFDESLTPEIQASSEESVVEEVPSLVSNAQEAETMVLTDDGHQPELHISSFDVETDIQDASDFQDNNADQATETNEAADFPLATTDQAPRLPAAIESNEQKEEINMTPEEAMVGELLAIPRAEDEESGSPQIGEAIDIAPKNENVSEKENPSQNLLEKPGPTSNTKNIPDYAVAASRLNTGFRLSAFADEDTDMETPHAKEASNSEASTPISLAFESPTVEVSELDEQSISEDAEINDGPKLSVVASVFENDSIVDESIETSSDAEADEDTLTQNDTNTVSAEVFEQDSPELLAESPTEEFSEGCSEQDLNEQITTSPSVAASEFEEQTIFEQGETAKFEYTPELSASTFASDSIFLDQDQESALREDPWAPSMALNAEGRKAVDAASFENYKKTLDIEENVSRGTYFDLEEVSHDESLHEDFILIDLPIENSELLQEDDDSDEVSQSAFNEQPSDIQLVADECELIKEYDELALDSEFERGLEEEEDDLLGIFADGNVSETESKVDVTLPEFPVLRTPNDSSGILDETSHNPEPLTDIYITTLETNKDQELDDDLLDMKVSPVSETELPHVSSVSHKTVEEIEHAPIFDVADETPTTIAEAKPAKQPRKVITEHQYKKADHSTLGIIAISLSLVVIGLNLYYYVNEKYLNNETPKVAPGAVKRPVFDMALPIVSPGADNQLSTGALGDFPATDSFQEVVTDLSVPLVNWGTHTVVKGDTLWGIADEYLNNPFRYPDIAHWSLIDNPDLIYPGDKVIYQEPRETPKQ